MKPCIWDDRTKVTILKEMWESGRYTARDIGMHIGCSRNSVIGKVNREGFRKPNSGVGQMVGRNKKRVLTPRAVAVRPVRTRVNTRVETVVEVPDVNDNRVGISIMQLSTKTCRAVLRLRGEDGLATYCGEPVLEGSFCPGHAAVYFQPREARRR